MKNVIVNYEEFKQAMKAKLKEFGNYHEKEMLDDIYYEIDNKEDFLTVELSSNWTNSGNVELVSLEIIEKKWLDDTLELKLKY